ncbi:MAG: type I methionyl aminopeptidase [Candidatus Paceibacterota bacterium]
MRIKIKTEAEIAILREGGKRLAFILHETAKQVAPGVKVKDLNTFAHKLMVQNGDSPAFLNYQPWGASRPYPASLCVSVNDEVVHGIPNERDRSLEDGDIVSLDAGLKHKGLFTDMAITVPVGEVDPAAKRLLKTTEQALSIGIAAAQSGKRVGEIGTAIEKFVKGKHFGIVETLSGHGVGYQVHEDPYVPNFKMQAQGPIMRPGLVIAIEPMLNEGTAEVMLGRDGYTYKTADGSRSAHFEHTVVITENGPEILTS